MITYNKLSSSGRLLKRGLSLLGFRLFQLPVWTLFYNRNGNRFKCDGRMFNCSLKLSGNGNKVIIEKGVSLNNVRIDITGSGNTLVIEQGTYWSEAGRIRIEDRNNSILIHSHNDFIGGFLTCSDENTLIEIGENCLFSAGVTIRSSDSHSILDCDGIRINPGKSVSIGRHVWIGNGATILKGAVIGENCVIGTGTVVGGKNFPAGSVIAGNPGKIVRTGINWNKQRL